MCPLYLSDEEIQKFGYLRDDLRTIFSLKYISSEDISDLINTFQSTEVSDYLTSLIRSSKPETALREAFFAGRSLISSFFGGISTPEVHIGTGFIDYILNVDGRTILIELKSLFDQEYQTGKTDRIKGLRQKEINYVHYKEQVLKYLREGNEYIILTDLKNWYFFNRQTNISNFVPFYKTNFHNLIEEFIRIGNFWDFIRRKDYQAVKDELDKKFFSSLKFWVNQLSEIKFDVDEKERMEYSIRLLNKFIFIQTLDDFFVIDAKWIKNNWDEKERKWGPKGKLYVLTEFLNEIDEWFYEYYDTELFRDNILKFVNKDEENVNKLYDKLSIILGVTGWQEDYKGIPGIIQYNFSFIDEDVLGKSYETYLAEVRHDEGIYYTPKYITEYIVKETVGKYFDEIMTKLKLTFDNENFIESQKLIEKFIEVKVLDPACGSGSFLIKSLRLILTKYRELGSLLYELNIKYNKYDNSLKLDSKTTDKIEQITNLINILKVENSRVLLSQIILRHIHGVDLDRKALEVTKVNLWLEAIKLAPSEFRFDRLPKNTNHILPNLEINLINGNTVVGLDENNIINYLKNNHMDDITQLLKLRSEYINNITHTENIEKILTIKKRIKTDLDAIFKIYLDNNNITHKIIEDTTPLYWSLELWYLYFDKGEIKNSDECGVDIVVGNPPYERIQVLNDKFPSTAEFLNSAGYKSATGNYDLAVIFIEKGFDILKSNGELGYIVTNKFMTGDYGEGLRTYLSKKSAISGIIDFGDQQVFSEATTYTAIIFLTKKNVDKIKFGLIKQLDGTLEQLNELNSYNQVDNQKIIVSTQEKKYLGKEPWAIIKSSEKTIIEKLENMEKLGKLTQIFVGLQTSADPVYVVNIIEDAIGLKKVFSKSLGTEITLEEDLLKPMLMGKDIERWITTEFNRYLIFPYKIEKEKAILVEENTIKDKIPNIWNYLNNNKEYLESRERGSWKDRPDWYGYVYLKNMDKFSKPKIITQVLANKASFACDLEGKYYFPGGGTAGGYGILSLDEKKLPLKYLCGLLNSLLLDWNVKKLSSRFRGGYYSYAKRYMENLPIKIPTNEKEEQILKQIENNVSQIMSYKLIEHNQILLWKKISESLANEYRSLLDILKIDEIYQKEGKFNASLTRSVTNYPSKIPVNANIKYNKLYLHHNKNEIKILIYGITEKDEEKMIYELKFDDEEILSHVYNSIYSALNSRMRINTINELLEKTKIPIIKPDIKNNSINIIKKLKSEINSKYSIAEINNLILECEASIDAMVFYMYGLNNREINTILNTLKIGLKYNELINKHTKFI